MSNRLLQGLGAILMAVLIVATQAQASSSTLENTEPNNTDASKHEVEGPLGLENSGSIVERLKRDAESKDYLFQFPGVNHVLEPWYDFKADLKEKNGFTFGTSFTTFYQKASDTIGPEDDAASYDLDISGTWTFLGRETSSPTMFGFDFLRRDTLDTELPPQVLFTQFGSLYSTAAPFGETDSSIGEFWIQQKFSNVFGFRVGQVFPITAYDFFPFKNFRTDFIDFNHVTNAAIPLPANGFGAFAVYRPHSKVMLRAGAHDANADTEEIGFDTYEKGELFKIFEIGFDTDLMPRAPGRPPHGHIHVSIWHQNEREEVGIDSGWGIAGTALQRFGRFTPFVRYGYTNHSDFGPTSVKYMANAGLVIDGIFGQANDRIGVGYTWTDPVNHRLDDQSQIDMYYRVQITPEIQFGPTYQIILDPVRNPEEDKVSVWGIRTRIEF